MLSTMYKKFIHLLVLFMCLITYEDGIEAHKLSERSSTSESQAGDYSSLTRKIVDSLSSSQPSWAPRDQHSLWFSDSTAPLRKEEQQHVVAFPDLLPLHQGNVHAAVDNAGVASSKFNWSVNDPPSGNYYGHQESRTGDNVDGSYYTLLPDGRLQKVDYHVDPTSGYVATISYNISDGTTSADDADLGEERQDSPQNQVPSETTNGGGDSHNAGLDSILPGTGTEITFNDEQPVGSQTDEGNLGNLNDDVDSSNNMPDSDSTVGKDEEEQSINYETENIQPNSDNDQLDPIDIPTSTGEQGVNEFSDSELEILLNEALKNYTDTSDSNLEDLDISSFNGNDPNSESFDYNSFPTFPDIDLGDIFGPQSFPIGGFDPKFPPPPVFIPLDANELSVPLEVPDFTSTS